MQPRVPVERGAVEWRGTVIFDPLVIYGSSAATWAAAFAITGDVMFASLMAGIGMVVVTAGLSIILESKTAAYTSVLGVLMLVLITAIALNSYAETDNPAGTAYCIPCKAPAVAAGEPAEPHIWRECVSAALDKTSHYHSDMAESKPVHDPGRC